MVFQSFKIPRNTLLFGCRFEYPYYYQICVYIYSIAIYAIWMPLMTQFLWNLLFVLFSYEWSDNLSANISYTVSPLILHSSRGLTSKHQVPGHSSKSCCATVTRSKIHHLKKRSTGLASRVE